MKTKHTPGPWKARKRSFVAADSYFEITGRDGCSIATTFDNLAESRENACLIAAAPELLEALETLITVITSNCLNPSNDECNAMVHAAQKAIAKAKGESK